MGAYDVFYAALDAVAQTATAGAATTSGATTLNAEGSAFTLTGAPSIDWVLGQVVALSGGGKTAYCRVVKFTAGGSSVTLRPLQTTLDSSGVIGNSFANGSTITGQDVFQDMLTLTIDLSDAPDASGYYNYAFLMAGDLTLPTASGPGRPKVRILRESLVGDPLGGSGSQTAGDAEPGINTGVDVDVTPVNFVWWATGLLPGQRYHYRVLVAPTSTATYVRGEHMRIVAIRYDTAFSAEQTTEVTTTSTTFQNVASTPAVDAGDYLLAASWLQALSGNGVADTGTGNIRQVNAATNLSSNSFSPLNTAEYNAFGFATVMVGVAATEVFRIRHRVEAGGAVGLTSKVKQARIIAVKLASGIAQAISRAPADGTNSSLTDNAWNTLLDSDQGTTSQTLSAGTWIDIIQHANAAGQTLRPDWATSLLQDADMRGLSTVPSSGSVGTRQQSNFFVNRHKRPGGTGKSRLLTKTIAGVTSASWRGVYFSFLRESAIATATYGAPLMIVAELETGIVYKQWTSAGSDKWQLDLPEIGLVTRVVVNGVDYTRQTSLAGVSSAKTFFWDVSGRRITIQMDTGDSPADTDRTVMIAAPLLIGREAEAIDDDDGVTRQYFPLLSKVPSVTQTLDVKGDGCETATSFGQITVLRDADEDDVIQQRIFDGLRLRVWRGYRYLQTALRDMERLLTAPLGLPKRDRKALTIDTHDASVILKRPVNAATISVYEGSTQRSDQLMPRIYGTVRRIPAYRTTDNASGTNTFQVTSVHALKACGALDSSGAFTAKAFKDGEAATAANTITNTLASGTFTVADTQADWKADVLYVDVQGVTDDGTSSGNLLESPGAIMRDLLVAPGGYAATQIVESSFRLLDRSWRVRKKSDGTVVPLGVKVALYLTEETIADALSLACRACFAYWAETRLGRIRVGVPDFDAQSKLTNGSFEQDSSSIWPYKLDNGATASIGSTVVYFGTRSLQLSNTNIGALQQLIDLHRPGRWAVTGLASLQSGDGSALRLSVVQPGDGLKRELSDVIELSSNQWSRASSVVDLPDGAAGTAVVEAIPYLPQGLVPTYPNPPGSLVLHLRADLLGLNDGDAVSTWADQSGSGNNATQSTGSKKPTFKANAIAGHPAVLIDDQDDAMDTPLSLSVPCTVMAVMQFRDQYQLGRSCRVLNGTNDWFVGFDQTLFAFTVQARAGASRPVPSSGATSAPYLRPVLVTLRQISSSSSELYVNGSLVGTQTGASQVGPGTLKLGLQVISATRGGPVLLAEVLAFNKALGTNKRSQYEATLMEKYGLRASTINLDMLRVVPVGITVSQAADDATLPHALDASIQSVEVRKESYYEALVPYNVSAQKVDRAPGALISDMQARGILSSYDPTTAEGRAVLLTSGRLDMKKLSSSGYAYIGDTTPTEAQKSAYGVGAPMAAWFGRQRNALTADVTDFDSVPEVGSFLFAQDIANVPRGVSDDPLWLITSVSDESNPAIELRIEADQEMDPVLDRSLIAASEIPLGAIVVCTASSCPTDYEEVTSMRGYYLQGAATPDQTSTFGSSHHVHDLTHEHTLPQHQHTAKATTGAVGASVTDGYSTQAEEKNRPLVVFGPTTSVVISAARGPTSGDHGHVIGTGTFTMNNNSAGTRSSDPTAALSTYRGSNDVKNLRVIFCRKTGKTVSTIPSTVVLGYSQATAPSGWSRQTSFYDRALRGADPGNVGYSSRAVTASHTQSDSANGGLGAYITADLTDVNLYQRVTVTEAANSYHGIVTSIDAANGRFTLLPSHETGDTADGTAYTTSATIAAGSEDVGATFDPTAHLHVRNGANGTGAVPGHQHSAAHLHSGIASGAPSITASDTGVNTVKNDVTGTYAGILHPHNHGFAPTFPSEGSLAATQGSSPYGGSITGSGVQVAPQQYAMPFIYNSGGTETAAPVGARIFADGAACPAGWAHVTDADERLILGASSGGGVVISDGGHSHPVDFAAHAFSHNHGSSYTDRLAAAGAGDTFKVGTDQPQSTSYFELDAYTLGQVATHEHLLPVSSISSVDPTLSAEAGKTTGTASGTSTIPISRRLMVCGRL